MSRFQLDSRDIDVLVEFAARLSIMLGLLALGVALGTHLDLYRLQAACVEAGALPPAGTRLPPGVTNAEFGESFSCWNDAKALQQRANWAVRVGAVLLLGGGVLDQYGREITDRVRRGVSA